MGEVGEMAVGLRGGIAGRGRSGRSARRAPAGAPRPEELAPVAASKALESRRSSDPGLVEAAVPAPMVAYRCVRRLSLGFGVDDPALVLPGPHRIPGYLVCVHGRSYISPLILASACDRHRGGAVLELRIPAGTTALWLAGNGDPASVNGADLICLDNVSIELTGWREELGTTILELAVHAD